jgi:Spy/CpxP family protein refolding chaperone
MRRLAAAAFVLLTMIPEVMRSQNETGHRHRWWQAPAFQRDLRLTPSQIQKLDALFERGLAERVARHQTIEEMDRLLARLMERGNADDASVLRLSEKVEALRAQENVRRTLMLAAMYRTLTREQRAAFTAMQRQSERSAVPPDRESPPHRD